MKTISLKGTQAANAVTPLSQSALIAASFPGRNFKGEYSSTENYVAGDVIAYKATDTSDPVFLEASTTIVAGYAFDLTKWTQTEPSGGSEYINAELRELFNLSRQHTIELDKWTKQRVQQGVVTIYNKYVVIGGVVSAVASSRKLTISATGTYTANAVSVLYMEGMPVNFTDAASVLTVPAGGTAATTYHACLKYDVSSNTVSAVLVADADLDGSYLKLYSILVPANDATADLTACTITDERRVEGHADAYYASAPYALVSIPGYIMPDAPEYTVSCDVESASDIDRVGQIKVYDKANNGFKITYPGSGDNVKIRWTLINPDI